MIPIFHPSFAIKLAVAVGCWTFLVPGLLPTSAFGADDLDLLEERAFRAAVERVAGSVVQIETIGGLERAGGVLFGAGPTSGLLIEADGYILSSAFAFLNRPTSILVRLPDGDRRAARLVATDHHRMVALLKIEVDSPLPVPSAVSRSQMRVGTWAIAVGRTFDPGQTNMSVGILSALDRVWGKAIQTDAACSPNNYGGPLIDIHGRVLGLIVPLSPQSTEKVAGIEWYDSGIGFAVPLDELLGIVAELKKGKDLHPGLIGIGLSGEGLYTAEPVLASVHPESPAEKAGLQKGDRILEIDGTRTTRAVQAKQEISRRHAGQKIRMVVLRGEKRIERELELVAQLEPYAHPFLGILPMRADPSPSGAASSDGPRRQGVVVRYVYPGGPAHQAKMEPGDAIFRVDGKPVHGAAELRRRVADQRPGRRMRLEVHRGSDTERFSVPLGRLPEGLPPKSLPPASLPPDENLDPTEPVEPAKPTLPAERPATGKFRIKIPEFPNNAWVYVPDNYDPAISHGIVVWMPAPGGLDSKAVLSRWKPHCDRNRLLLVTVDPADPSAWRTAEIELVVRLLDEIDSTYSLDPARVVVGGRESGGTLAALVALGYRDLIRAVALVDAPLGGRAPEAEPGRPLAIYSANAQNSPLAASIDEGIDQLRAGNYPVTTKRLGETPRMLNDDELAELARWIDMLDRI